MVASIVDSRAAVLNASMKYIRPCSVSIAWNNALVSSGVSIRATVSGRVGIMTWGASEGEARTAAEAWTAANQSEYPTVHTVELVRSKIVVVPPVGA